MTRSILWTLPLTALVVLAGSLRAADSAAVSRPAATRPASSQPSAEDIMRKMGAELGPPRESVRPVRVRPLPPRQEVDPAIVGVAPGLPTPKLRMEGEFISNRLGRLIRTPKGGQTLLVFEADASNAPEAPLVMLPCGKLEAMEEVVAQRGEGVVFRVSGQVTRYRGANYFLPTMMVIIENQGNIQK